MNDKKILVAYFSCTGVTARAAQKLAEAAQADLYEIKPEQPYTQADLNLNNKNSRSSQEMNDPASRPAIVGKVENMEQYDTVFVGFPIWWYVAPTIINTFLESYDFSGETAKRLRASCAAKFAPGKMLNGALTKEALQQWINGLLL